MGSSSFDLNRGSLCCEGVISRIRRAVSDFKLRGPGDITVDASRPFLALAEQHSLIIPGLGCDTGAKRKKKAASYRQM